MQVSCTQCGASLPVTEDDRFLVCDYCSSSLFLDRGRSTESYYIKPHLDEAEALAKVDEMVNPGSSRNRPRTTHVRKLLVPFRESQGEAERTIELAAELPVSLDGLRRLQGDREYYAPDVMPSWEHVPPGAATDGPSPARVGCTLVQHPMYRIDYLFGDREYVIFIDGVTGAAFADELPTRAAQRLNLGFLLILVLSFAIYAVIIREVSPLRCILLVVPAFFMLSWVTAFRLGGR